MKTGTDGRQPNATNDSRKTDAKTDKHSGKAIVQSRSRTIKKSGESRTDEERKPRGSKQESPSVGLRFGRRSLQIISIKINETPRTLTARIVSPDLKTKTNLLLDSGSEINIIKKLDLPDSAIMNEQEKIEVRGITVTSLVTLGQTIIQVAGHPVTFHVVDDSLLIDQDGILGSEFFAGCRARSNYGKNILSGEIFIFHSIQEKR